LDHQRCHFDHVARSDAMTRREFDTAIKHAARINDNVQAYFMLAELPTHRVGIGL